MHLGWIDKLLDNISTIFIDLYKDQLLSIRARVVEYQFDKYFDQQVQELEDNTGFASSGPLVADGKDKKDPLVSSDNGGPPPPPAPGLLKGMLEPASWMVHIMLTTESAASSCARWFDLR